MADSTDPYEWLRYAEADLSPSRIVPPVGVFLELLCYHAQRATEKAIKAVMLARGSSIRKTHDINLLVELVVGAGAAALPLSREAAESLTLFAVLSRYPSDLGDVDEAEWQRAVGDAAAVVAWARAELERA